MKNSLVPVFNGTINNIPSLLCNARDLHKVLGVGRVFANWIKGRIEEYGFMEGEDYLPVLANRSDGKAGKPRIEYHLTLDMGKELSMLENNEQGRIARRYFIECERKLAGHKEIVKKPKPGLNPDFDVRAVMLDGLPKAPWIQPEIEDLIHVKALQLAQEAHTIITEHIRRRVFDRAFVPILYIIDDKKAKNAIRRVTLSNTLVYRYYDALSKYKLKINPYIY